MCAATEMPLMSSKREKSIVSEEKDILKVRLNVVLAINLKIADCLVNSGVFVHLDVRYYLIRVDIIRL